MAAIVNKLFDEINDIFFGGDEIDAANREATATREGALIGLQGAREGLQYHQNTTRPIRYGSGAAYNAYLNAVGLGGDQQDFSDEYNFGGAGGGTTFGVPTGGPSTPEQLDRPGNGAALLATGALLAGSPLVRGAVGAVAQGAVRGVGGLLNRGGDRPEIAGETVDASGRIRAEAGNGLLAPIPEGAFFDGAGRTGTTAALNSGGFDLGAAPTGNAPIPESAFFDGSPGAAPAGGAPAAAPAPSQGILGRVFQGSNQYSNNLLKFGTPAVAGALAGFTTDGSPAKRAGAGIGAAAGQYFGGPIGSFIGSKLGGAIGGQVRSRNDRFGVQYDPRTGTLFDEGGTRLNEGDLRDYQSNLNPSADYPGHYELPGASLDGHSLLIDSQGNIVSGTNGSGLTGPLGNVLSGDAPVGLSWNGQNVTNTGGGHPGYGQYDPSQFQQPQVAQQPTIGIPSGEGPGGFLGGTQVIPENGLPPDVGEAIPGVGGGEFIGGSRTNPNLSPGVTGNLPTDSEYGGFLSSPNYNYIRDEVTRGVGRNAVARGDIGNRYDDAMAQRIAGIASGNYQNYLANLQNAFAPGTAAIQQLGSSGQQGINNGFLNYGQGVANAGSVLAVGGLRENEAQRNTFGALGRLFV